MYKGTIRIVALIVICFLVIACANKGNVGNIGGNPNPNTGNIGGNPSPVGQEDPIQQKIKSMSLDEKLGLMIVAGMEGTTASNQTKRMIEDQHVGGVIFYQPNVTDPAGVAAYVNQLKAWNQKNPSPLLLTVDQEGGIVSRLPGLEKFPNAKDIGRVNDPTYANHIGSYLGQACKAMGMNVDFAPVLDINSNPKNPVIGVRSYGPTADVVVRSGIPVMQGIQSTGVIPVIKHFPGHGDTSVDSHIELPVVYKSLTQLRSFEWVPFKEAIHQGADMVMVAHILFPQIDNKYPASLSKEIITNELRGTLGFKGVVITDDLTMGAIAKHYGIGQAAVLSVKAGSDILLVAHGYDNVSTVIAALKQSIASGDITEDRIDESVARILKLKEKYGLTDSQIIQTPNLGSLNAAIRKEIAAH